MCCRDRLVQDFFCLENIQCKAHVHLSEQFDNWQISVNMNVICMHRLTTEVPVTLKMECTGYILNSWPFLKINSTPIESLLEVKCNVMMIKSSTCWSPFIARGEIMDRRGKCSHVHARAHACKLLNQLNGIKSKASLIFLLIPNFSHSSEWLSILVS